MSDYKMFVWRHHPDFVVMVHAKTVAEAMELALVYAAGLIAGLKEEDR